MKKNRILVMIVLCGVCVSLILSGCSNTKTTDNTTTPTTTATKVTTAGSNETTTEDTTTEETTKVETTIKETQDPYGKYDPVIKITTVNMGRTANDTLPEGQTYKDNIWTRAYLDDLGIEVDVLFEAFMGAEASTKMNLLIATGDLPDLFGIQTTLLPQLIKAEQLADLTDVYDDYASPELKMLYGSENGQYMLKAVSRNGKLYGLPNGGSTTENTQMLYIRKDWMENLGLEIPKNLDDVIAICDAFVNDDPDGDGEDDTYGLGLFKDIFSWEVCLTGFFNAFHAYPNTAALFNWLEDSNGELVPGIKQPEVKDALLKLNEMYNNGLIDPEFITKDGNALTEDITQGKVGIFFGGTWEPDWRLKPLKVLCPESDWIIMRSPSVDENPASTIIENTSVSGINVVNADCEYPEALIKIANLGKKYEKEDYNNYIQDADNNRFFRVAVAIPNIEAPNGWIFSKSLRPALDTGDTSTLTDFGLEIVNRMNKWYDDKDLNEWGVARIFGYDSTFDVVTEYSELGLLKRNEFYGEMGEAHKKYFPSLRGKEYEVITKIITGELDITGWEEFIEYWDTQGGKEIEKEVNDWYDELKS